MAIPDLVVAFDDIQGLLRSGYGRLVEAVFLLLRIEDAASARAWIGRIAGDAADHVTSMADLKSVQDAALQIAFTAPGLRRLGVADDIVGAFSPEFYDGMASEAAWSSGRSRRLGDTGANAPAHWSWGAGATMPDAVVLLYARAGGLAALQARVTKALAGGFAIIEELPTTYKLAGAGDRLEHFGFIDGTSQPVIDWQAQRDPTSSVQPYSNLLAAGEFLLGYSNEYGLFEDRPLLEPARDPLGLLAPAADEPGKRDLARNGSYLVFRQLQQDVEGFWRFLAEADPEDGGRALAEAMIGRRLASGDPLVPAATQSIAGVGPGERDQRRNGFTFDSDTDGLSCPFGAHIRRANPRTADLPGGQQGVISRVLRNLGLKHRGPREDLVSAARFHRILRRGRSYGAFDDAAPEADIGLHFLGLNASISRQFEFIQNAWLVNPTFNGMSGESDPLLGNRLEFPAGHPTNAFTRPRPEGPCRRLAGVPQFITVRGGAYFFLPSLRALRYFAHCLPC